ncbi:MAG: acyltransferase [Bacteroidota bacterium]
MKKIIKILISIPMRIIKKVAGYLPYFKFIEETKDSQTPISFEMWYRQKVLGYNRNAYWPVHFTSTVSGKVKNVYCGIETCPGYSPGCYIQAIGKIFIGDYTQIAPNVGIISSNHDPHDNSKHIVKAVKIGAYGWIGMGALIMPGVELGDFTVVGAGAVVTKSFPEGHCIIGGNPAKKIKSLDPAKCVRNRSKIEYNGYIRSDKFEMFKKSLNF